MTLASELDVGARASAQPLAQYRAEFPIFRDTIYLNTCSLGALGDRTRRRMEQFLDLWQARGASAWYDVWWAALGELRARYARTISAGPDEIALAPSISVAISTIAEALDYRARPRVVVTSLDFPTVPYQWLPKRGRGGGLGGVEGPGRVSVAREGGARRRAGGRRESGSDLGAGRGDRARGGRADRARRDVARLFHERR